jgi:hypothetical protein
MCSFLYNYIFNQKRWHKNEKDCFPFSKIKIESTSVERRVTPGVTQSIKNEALSENELLASLTNLTYEKLGYHFIQVGRGSNEVRIVNFFQHFVCRH